MYKPSYELTKMLAESEQYGVIPISKEIFLDIITPVELLKILQNVSNNCFMLESIEDTKQTGRYTFLGFNPLLELVCRNGKMKIKSIVENEFETTNPSSYIQKIIDENKSPNFDYLPTFTGGFVGYFSYDYIKYSEPKLELLADDVEEFNDVDLMLFDKVIVFDNLKKNIVIIVNVKTDNISDEYERGIKEIDYLENLIKNGVAKKNKSGRLISEFKTLFTKDEYCKMVNKAKNYIAEGDIFQVVLSNKIEAEYEGNLLDIYCILRKTNPSPYMFYFSNDSIEITGASPETLVKLDGENLYAFPLAGTRPRGINHKMDLELERELLSDEKELAEHNMLVDLGRNDLGKVSRFGTVNVEKYLSIKKFSHVMHIGSVVSGKLQDNKSAMDVLSAVLPAGTLSGAPKIRACEIIDQLENDKRGVYGGAIGYLDFKGSLDTCIAIRAAYKKNGKIFIRSGAGIVADSIPEKEYQECIDKAKAVVKAIELAQGGVI